MNIITFSKSKDGNIQLSKNFKVKEFACKDGSDRILIDIDMIPILQRIRDIGGRVVINSAYRTPEHNKKVGGTKNSYHLKGMAFDIVVENLSTIEVCDLANTLGVKGIIKYPTFVHIDDRPNKYHADNKGNILIFKEVNKMETFDEAIQYLQEQGIIDSPDYWNKVNDTTKNIDKLFIKFANAYRNK